MLALNDEEQSAGVSPASYQSTTKAKQMKVKFMAIIDTEAAMKAVERNSDALRYVKDQTEAVCLKAVENDGYALRYVLIKEFFLSIAAKLNIEVEV